MMVQKSLDQFILKKKEKKRKTCYFGADEEK